MGVNVDLDDAARRMHQYALWRFMTYVRSGDDVRRDQWLAFIDRLEEDFPEVKEVKAER